MSHSAVILPSRIASAHFGGRYPFPVPRRVGGRVGPGVPGLRGRARAVRRREDSSTRRSTTRRTRSAGSSASPRGSRRRRRSCCGPG